MTPKMQEAREAFWAAVKRGEYARDEQSWFANVSAHMWNAAIESAVQIVIEARGEGHVDLRTIANRILALKAQP